MLANNGVYAPGADHVSQHWKKYATGGLVAAVVILVIIVAWFMYTGDKGKMSNLTTGGNNPQWQNQRGDAGWGGPLHSTYNNGDSRVFAASNDRPDYMSIVNNPYMTCGTQSQIATEEAQTLGPRGLQSLSDASLGMYMQGN